MRFFRARSLERKLTRRMVVVQILSLGLFFGLGIFPLVIYPALSQSGTPYTLDPTPARDFAAALRLSADGKVEPGPSARIDQLRKDFPSIFFFAQTEDGATASLGDLPERVALVTAQIGLVEAIDVRMRNGGIGSFLVRHEPSAIGPVQVLVGNGPAIGLEGLMRSIAISVATGVGIVLTSVSAFAIPAMVRRELRGVQQVAGQAERINFDNRGVRLKSDGIPDEIASLVNAVNLALARLDQAYEGRKRFLAAAAHEIKTPIAILQLRLEESAPFPERARLTLDAARLADLAEQLLELQRLEHTAPVFSEVDLVALAEGVVADLAPLAIASGYEISVVSSRPTVLAWGEADGLGRALSNLVQNAISHGGGQGSIVVTVLENPAISVADSGRGIPEAERQRIFEPFQRLHRSGNGSGLGLNLVRSIMDRHGGSVSVASNADQGATFVLHLPKPDTQLPAQA